MIHHAIGFRPLFPVFSILQSLIMQPHLMVGDIEKSPCGIYEENMRY
jgi:hypothetical protein